MEQDAHVPPIDDDKALICYGFGCVVAESHSLLLMKVTKSTNRDQKSEGVALIQRLIAKIYYIP